MNAQVQQNAEWNYLSCTTSPDTPINHPTCRVSKCWHSCSALNLWIRSLVLFGFRGQPMYTLGNLDQASRQHDQNSEIIIRNVGAVILRTIIPSALQLSCTFQWAGDPKGTQALCEWGDPRLLVGSAWTISVEIPEINRENITFSRRRFWVNPIMSNSALTGINLRKSNLLNSS